VEGGVRSEEGVRRREVRVWVKDEG
jgi:hypothetical protein